VENLPQNYRLEVGGKEAIIDKTGSPISYYQLNGEKCAATFAMPFGIDSTTVSLRDDQGKILSRLRIAYSYPLPELLYIDVRPHDDIEANDTTRTRRFLPGYNKVPTTYSGNGGVPDQLAIGEITIYIGFKKTYYDGFVRHVYVRHRVTRKESESDIKLFPPKKISDGELVQSYGSFREVRFSNAQIDQTSSRWDWLIDGHYEFLYTYSSAAAPPGRYPFEIRHHWLRTWLYNLSAVMWLLPRVLVMTPWLTFLLVSVLAYFYIRKRLRKAAVKAQKANLELQAIQSQLNPHFVFNALGSLQGLINKNDTEKANTYLTGFSRLLRNTLNNSGKEMVPLSAEIADIENYIRLEQLRFGFLYEIATDERTGSAQVDVPSLLIQPIVENSIKHGISVLGSSGRLTLGFMSNNSDLLVSVKDNGRGFDPAMTPEGRGIALTRERIKLLNKQRYRISMNISSGSEGTEVSFIFKNWL